jgi:hypothetical protein
VRIAQLFGLRVHPDRLGTAAAEVTGYEDPSNSDRSAEAMPSSRASRDS